MNSAIIVAAGEGSRFGGARPKQFAEILGKPVLIHTVERFERSPLVGEIILVLPESELFDFSNELEKAGVTKVSAVVSGGSSRLESVMNGLASVRWEETTVVAIHDGARPVLAEKDLRAVMLAAERDGAACLTAPVTDTMKEVAYGKIVRTVDRILLRRALTPQCFRADVIRDSYDQLGPDSVVTDDSSIAEAAGIPVTAVEGDPSNIKITYEHDLYAAEVFLKKLLEQE